MTPIQIYLIGIPAFVIFWRIFGALFFVDGWHKKEWITAIICCWLSWIGIIFTIVGFGFAKLLCLMEDSNDKK